MHQYRIYIIGGVLLLALLAVAVSVAVPISDEYSKRGTANDVPSLTEQAAALVSSATASFRNPAAAVLGCGLTLSVSPSMQMISPLGTNTYRVLVENRGQDSCERVSVSVYYGENESFVSAVPQPQGGDSYWTVPSLAPGTALDVTITTTGTFGEIKNEICATADNAAGDECTEIYTTVGSESENTPVSPGKEFGTWIWKSPVEMDTTYIMSMLEGLESGGFNAVYVTIDDYLPIASLPAGRERQARAEAYFAKLSQFVSEANNRGIAVDAEGGWKDWTASEHKWKSYALINFVSEYNAAYPNTKVRGLQFDVEPYLLPTYESNKGPVLTEFVSYVDDIVSRMQRVDARVSFVIPHFYDAAQKWTPTIAYNGTTKYAFSHLLDILEQKKGSSIIVMSYRDFFDGHNGIKQISEAEIKESADGKYATTVIVAQETGNVDPDYVTFYGQSRQDVLNAAGTIQKTFRNYSQFGGVAIHYLDTFLELE